MTLDVHFTGGPLDGAILEGELPPTVGAGTYLATKIYRDTRCGLVGSVFEMFNPFMLLGGVIRTRIGLHRYRVDLHLPPAGERPVQLYVTYLEALHQSIGVTEDDIQEWVKR